MNLLANVCQEFGTGLLTEIFQSADKLRCLCKAREGRVRQPGGESRGRQPGGESRGRQSHSGEDRPKLLSTLANLHTSSSSWE